MKKIKLLNKEVIIDELTLKQDIELIKLFKDINLNLNNIDLKDIIKILIENNILVEFFKIILNNQLNDDEIMALKNKDILEVIDNFLSLNKELIKKLISIFSSLSTTVE